MVERWISKVYIEKRKKFSAFWICFVKVFSAVKNKTIFFPNLNFFDEHQKRNFTDHPLSFKKLSSNHKNVNAVSTVNRGPYCRGNGD